MSGQIFAQGTISVPKTTLPSDIGDTCFSRSEDRIVLCLREPLANGITFGATEAFALHYQHRPDEQYLIYASDADGFENKKAIVSPGIIPNVSAGSGHSYQGCGLVTITGLMVARLSRMRLVIGSKCKDGTWAACMGQMSPTRENEWEVADVSQEWFQILLNIFGKRFQRYHVYYAFRVDLPSEACLLNEATIASLHYMCPGFLSRGGKDDPQNGIKLEYSRTLIVNK